MGREMWRREEGESDPDSIRCSAVWVFSVLHQPPCWRAVGLTVLTFSLFISSPVCPGAETHTHTEALTVAANWTDSLAIDLLQVSPILSSVCSSASA